MGNSAMNLSWIFVAHQESYSRLFRKMAASTGTLDAQERDNHRQVTRADSALCHHHWGAKKLFARLEVLLRDL